MPLIILASWMIAFFEYCFMIPANRIGYGYFSAVQLKTIQEVVTLSIFSLFTAFYLGEPLKWNHAVGFGLICVAVYVIFEEW